jgi:SAM-dependent methyltransferase
VCPAVRTHNIFAEQTSLYDTMKTNVVAYYRKHDDFSRYLVTDKRRAKQHSRLYDSNKRYFGHRVLDIACGGGVLGFIIEGRGHSYTGTDVNPDMISSARNYAKRIGSRNRFIKADVTQTKIEQKFDTICILGNALCHFSTHDFSRILQNTAAHRGAYFMVDYRDMVRLMFDKKWNDKKRLVEKERGRIATTEGCDTRSGFVLVTSTDLHGSNEVGFAHAIWSPFIIEPIMNDHGWSLVKRTF